MADNRRVTTSPILTSPLAARIHTAIAAAGGWMAFDAFMAEALYAPGLGYYAGGRRKFGSPTAHREAETAKAHRG